MVNAKRKTKQTLSFLTTVLLLNLLSVIWYQPQPMYAQSGGNGGGSQQDNQESAQAQSSVPPKKDPALKCVEGDKGCDLVGRYINPIVGFLAAFAGIAVTIGIITGGIRYASAGDDPQKMGAAKKHISIAIFSLLAFLVLYAALQWLVPQTVR